MSVSFKKPDGTIRIDGDDYRRHANPSGERGGLVDVRTSVGTNVTVPRGLLVCGTGELPNGSTVAAGSTFTGLVVYEFDTTQDD